MADQKQIIEAIAEILTLPVGDIDPTASLQDDLGLSRMEVADLFHNLAAKFNIIFDPSETEQVKTIGDLIDLIEDKSLE
ncbi:acyl carrier protein [Candidatus Daviesbacteria bacterium]|nr:acyl carrier protein [Candidatus Daviesbacteria bacterium]